MNEVRESRQYSGVWAKEQGREKRESERKVRDAGSILKRILRREVGKMARGTARGRHGEPKKENSGGSGLS